MIQTFLNPEGHPNRISGSKVTAILLKGWILPIGEASSVECLRSTGLPRLISEVNAHLHDFFIMLNNFEENLKYLWMSYKDYGVYNM